MIWMAIFLSILNQNQKNLLSQVCVFNLLKNIHQRYSSASHFCHPWIQNGKDSKKLLVCDSSILGKIVLVKICWYSFWSFRYFFTFEKGDLPLIYLHIWHKNKDWSVPYILVFEQNTEMFKWYTSCCL